MNWTALDYLFAVIIAVSTGFALTKGLARELISLASLILGFLLASYYYGSASLWFADFTKTRAIAELIAFLVIFLGCLVAGAAAAYVVNRFVKMASLEWMDRLLGSAYGFLRGWAVSSIIVLALVAFWPRSDWVARSALAPYLLAGARAAVLAVPGELREKFNVQYRKLLDVWNQGRADA